MSTSIRPEEAIDAPAIERVTMEAFKNAPHTDHTEQFTVREFRLAEALTVPLEPFKVLCRNFVPGFRDVQEG